MRANSQVIKPLNSSGKQLDLITIGRSSVDLYGSQIGGRLEDMNSFRKYVGGSPTNIAVGAARLGVAAGLFSAVGDEHMGRFIKEQLIAEGVDISSLKIDKERLTALAILGVRSEHSFPLIFYREKCADMGLTVDDVSAEYFQSAAVAAVTGTHLSNEQTEKAVIAALDIAHDSGAKLALDIDYRPNLWDLAGHGAGEQRYIESKDVTARLQQHLSRFDLIAGTEEEFHIAGGSVDTIEALHAIRKLTDAVLVCKLGSQGAVAFTAEIPADLDGGIKGRTFEIEVFNVLGAGDGFMAGLLRGYIGNESWETSLTWANACGALAVSRHGCAPAYPSWYELEWLVSNGSEHKALRKDTKLEHIHRATNRSRQWPRLCAFAFDHRTQLIDIARQAAASEGKISSFKLLCLKAAKQVAGESSGFGILCDEHFGRAALHEAAGCGLWIARPVEKPDVYPLELDIGLDYGSALNEWPTEHVAKVLCICSQGESDQAKHQREEILLRLQAACHATSHELLVEIIAPSDSDIAAETAQAMSRIYDIGVKPDWWKLQPINESAGWTEYGSIIKKRDPLCRGIVVLGSGADENAVKKAFAAAPAPYVCGFAVGRTIFEAAARQWLAGKISDDEAIADIAKRFASLADAWDAAR